MGKRASAFPSIPTHTFKGGFASSCSATVLFRFVTKKPWWRARGTVALVLSWQKHAEHPKDYHLSAFVIY